MLVEPKIELCMILFCFPPNYLFTKTIRTILIQFVFTYFLFDLSNFQQHQRRTYPLHDDTYEVYQ